ASHLRHAGIHVGVLVRLARDRGLQVVRGAPDREIGGRVADGGEVVEMAMGMAGFAFGRGAEQGGDLGMSFHVRLVREVEIASIRLALASEGRLQVFVRTGSLEARHGSLLWWVFDSSRRRACAGDHSRGGGDRQLRLWIPVIACAYGPRLRGGGIAGALVGAAAATTLVRQLENRRQPAARPV